MKGANVESKEIAFCENSAVKETLAIKKTVLLGDDGRFQPISRSITTRSPRIGWHILQRLRCKAADRLESLIKDDCVRGLF